MSYRDFTIKDVKQKLGLKLVEDRALHDDAVEVAPGPHLVEWLQENSLLALDINTEKARSEMIIAPILLEVRRLLNRQIGYFSGRELYVDQARGLTGVCDFLLSLSAERLTVTAPLVVVAEAKNLDMVSGIPQCVAEMFAVHLFNQQEGIDLPSVHGVVSTGSNWRFLRLDGQVVCVDVREYYLHDLNKILGILCHVLRQGMELARRLTTAPAVPPTTT